MRMKITTTAIYFEYYSSSCILKMLYFDSIDISEETDVNKTGESKKSDLCHYW